MPTPGLVFKDLHPLPNDVSAATEPDKHEPSHAMGEEPTLSHALAVSADHGGHAQQGNEDDIKGPLALSTPPFDVLDTC